MYLLPLVLLKHTSEKRHFIFIPHIFKHRGLEGKIRIYLKEFYSESNCNIYKSEPNKLIFIILFSYY